MSFKLGYVLLEPPFTPFTIEREFSSIKVNEQCKTTENVFGNNASVDEYAHRVFDHTGFILNTPTQLFYNTVYFDPKFFNLGNVTTSYNLDLIVWNACLKPIKLNEIEYDDTQGVIIETPNLDFRQLELKKYQLKVNKDGSPLIDILAKFKFSNGFQFVLAVTGSRTVIVGFIPDQEFVEILKFKTEISQSRRKELRAKLASKPTREFQYTYTLNEPLLSHFADMFNSAQTKQYLVPTWQEMMYIPSISANTSTISLRDDIRGFTTGSYLMVWNNEFDTFVTEIKQIVGKEVRLKEPIPRDFGKCYVIPCVPSTITEHVAIKRPHMNNLFKADVTYQQNNIDLDQEELTLPMLNGEPILDIRQRDGSISSLQKVKIINDSFAEPFVHAEQDKSLYKLGYQTAISSLEQYHKWYDFVAYCSGRFKAFWLPTWYNDLTLGELILPQQVNIVLQYNISFKERNAIRIELAENVYYGKIVNNLLENGKTKLILDKPIPFGVNLDDTYRISLMYRVRLEKDDFRITHESYYHKNISFGTSEVL